MVIKLLNTQRVEGNKKVVYITNITYLNGNVLTKLTKGLVEL